MMALSMTQISWHVTLVDEARQILLGRHLGAALAYHGNVWLEGDLGAGKTTLTRGILQGAGHEGAVKSPTYTLLEPYEVAGRHIHHFDLYRLADPEELAFIGARELFDDASLNIIEWPSQGQGELPDPDVIVTLAVLDEGRRAQLQGLTPHGEKAIATLQHSSSEVSA